AVPGGRLYLLPFGEPGEKRHHDRPRRPGRRGKAPSADPGARRCRDPQSQIRRARQIWPRRRRSDRRQPGAGLRQRHRLRGGRSAYDPMEQAYSGRMSLLGEDGRPPVRVTASIIDMGGAMWSAIGILAALQERQRTGKGGIVDTSLLETGLSWMTIMLAAYM